MWAQIQISFLSPASILPTPCIPGRKSAGGAATRPASTRKKFLPCSAVEIGGYYRPDADLVAGVMRPSATFNAVIDAL